MKIYAALLAFLLAFPMLTKANDDHKFYTSLTEIEYNQETATFEVAIRLFFDDLGVTLRELRGHELSEDVKEETEILTAYLRDHFRITIDDKAMAQKIVGAELEADVLWVYMEINDIPETFESLHITNTVLMEIFTDQVNIVNYFGDKKQSTAKGVVLSARNEGAGFIDLE